MIDRADLKWKEASSYMFCCGHRNVAKHTKREELEVPRTKLAQKQEEIMRVEREEVDIAQGNVSEDGDRETNRWVVHDYGHAGEGYQMSVGCTQDAVELVEGIFRTR